MRDIWCSIALVSSQLVKWELEPGFWGTKISVTFWQNACSERWDESGKGLGDLPNVLLIDFPFEKSKIDADLAEFRQWNTFPFSPQCFSFIIKSVQKLPFFGWAELPKIGKSDKKSEFGRFKTNFSVTYAYYTKCPPFSFPKSPLGTKSTTVYCLYEAFQKLHYLWNTL